MVLVTDEQREVKSINDDQNDINFAQQREENLN